MKPLKIAKINTYRYSEDFFGNIALVDQPKVIELLKKVKNLEIKFKDFDDAPYTKITSITFRQMRQLLQRLKIEPIPDELRDQIDGLFGGIADVIANGSLGDRMRTFVYAIPVYKKIQEIYPSMQSLVRQRIAFEIALEIQGLNEYFGEFSQINRITLHELIGLVEYVVDNNVLVVQHLSQEDVTNMSIMPGESIEEFERRVVRGYIERLRRLVPPPNDMR